ncbi:MAG: glycosyltransferase [Gammaproteobacteria bacterium]|nr:glycosyltransferase [Gammaproteobacteria bacterium]
MPSRPPILLIAYKYPPYPLVGAFRWTRFSKYLAELGHPIEVVTVNWKLPDTGNLLPQVQHPNIRIHRIPSGYPHNFRMKRTGHRLLDSLRYRIFSHFIDRYFYWDDEAQHWGRHLLPKCREIIQNRDIRVVIATGSPFRSNYWAAQLKRELPHIRLIQDLRDPWVRNPLKRFPNRKLALKVENETLSAADHIVTVSEGMAEHFRQNLDRDVPVSVINNGFDPSLLIADEVDKAKVSGKIPVVSIVYTGSLSNGREELLTQLLDSVERQDTANLKLAVAGNYSYKLAERYRRLIDGGILELCGLISQHDAFRLISRADFALQLNAAIYPYALSTKIFEYAAMRVPCLSLNFGGDIDRTIRECSLGYSIDLRHEKIDPWVAGLAGGQLSREFDFSIEAYSYKTLSAKYSDLILRMDHD